MAKSLSIAKKIWLPLSILLIGYFASMLCGFVLGEKTESKLHNVSEYMFPAAIRSQLALSAFNEQLSHYSQATLTGDTELLEEAKDKSLQIKDVLNEIASLKGLDAGRLNQIRETTKRFDRFTESARTVYAAISASSDDHAALAEFGQKASELADQAKKLLKQFEINTADFDNDLKNELSEIRKESKETRYMNLLIFTVLAAFALAAIQFLITRSITGPVKRVISGLNRSATRMTDTSARVLSVSHMLNRGASEQTASIEETSSALDGMSSVTRNNADNAKQANGLVKEASSIVKKANEVMEQLNRSMEEIGEASEKTSRVIKNMEEITFQTNLLALNAAVEAARAGEAGAGFSVVADEVRQLAIRAADAAGNTTELIEGTIGKVQEGEEIVTLTNKEFSRIKVSITRINDLIEEIAAASEDQAHDIARINTNVAEMDKVVHQNATNAEASASSSEAMTAQAKQMEEFVNELSVLVRGK